jgi:capsular exopolysaccharide synthesis family protein
MPSIKNMPDIEKELSESQIDIVDLIKIIWGSRIWIIFITILFASIGFLYLKFISVPIYSSTSVVMMESRQPELVGLDSIIGDLSTERKSVVNTEVEVLRGRNLMGRVVDDQNLVADSEFNGTLRPPSLYSRFKSAVFGAPTIVFKDPKRERDSVISALLRSVAITNVPDSLVFQIEVESESPTKSAEISDAIARLYIDDQIRIKFDATKKAAEWLTEQVAGLKTELEKSEGAIRRFQSSTILINADTLGAIDRQLKDTRQRRLALEDQIAAEMTQRRALENATLPTARELPDTQLRDLGAAAVNGDKVAAASFEQRRALLLSQLDQDASRLWAQVNSLKTAEQDLSQTIHQQSMELIKLEQMNREAESSKLLYEHFQTRLKEAVAQEGIQQADSRVISDAVIPSKPISPRKPLIIGMMTVFGLALGCVFVLVREMFASGVRTANELQEITGCVVLGQIPFIPVHQRGKLLSYLTQNPTSATAEAMRNLRTSILLSDIDRAPQVIMITSSVPAEGKTTISLSLAFNMTSIGKKVLLIEGDIRRRNFKKYFNLTKNEGLVAALSSAVRLEDIVQSVSGIGDVLIGERTDINPADLFSSEAFARLIADAKKNYDVIIIDTPPVLVVPDARVIAPTSDAIIFVVHWNSTSKIQAQEGIRMLDLPNTRVAGAVLSQIDPKGMRRYGYGERYAAYGSYGAEYYTAD